jgi:uncharacterized membrane protein HdeD (DUF308 family)
MAASDARWAGPVPHDREVPATAGPRGPAWTQAGHLFSVVAVATFVLGLMLLVWPGPTTIVVAVIIGVSLLVTGLSRLIEGLTADDAAGSMRPAQVIVGLLAEVAGLYCVRHIEVTVSLLAFIVGAFWVLHGVVDLTVAAAGPGQARGLRRLVGGFSLAAGLSVLFWPAISMAVLLAVIGTWLMFYGLMLAMMASQFRHLAGTGPVPA